jgi:hypothetical protein
MEKTSRVSAAVLFSALFAVATYAAPPTYTCQGFDEPMNRPNIHIGRGRVLPLRAKLALPDGTYGDDAVLKAAPQIALKYKPDSGAEVDKSSGIEVRDYGKGTSFVFDKEAHWKFDMGTGNLADNGKYTVTLLSGDPKEYKVDPACSLNFVLGSD